MTGQWLPIAMLVALIAGAFSGYPMGFVMAGIAVGFCLVADVPIAFLFTFVTRIYAGILADWLLLSIPLFVYMGLMLDKSGIAGRLLTSLARLMGPLPGGYAIAVAVIGIIMAASTGIVGASIVMLGLLGLPAMLDRGYDPQIATGIIAASGTLGILIPPSIMLVVLGEVLQVSVGDLFLGALVPGIMLGLLFIIWILIGAVLWPQRMPAIERREGMAIGALLLEAAANLVAPLGLIVAVLGSIAAGIATPTEAAAIGALGATILAAFSREFRWSSLPPILHSTTRTTAMIAMVMIGATCFTGLFLRIGGDDLVRNMLFVDTVGAWGVLIIIMLAVFVLGFVLEWVEITFILIVLVAPIVADLNFGMGMTREETLIWFGILVAVNLQTSFISPPFGASLYYLKGICPPHVTIGTIYRGVTPFMVIQLIPLLIAMAWPPLILWLPKLMR